MAKRFFMLALVLSTSVLPAHADTSGRLGPPYHQKPHETILHCGVGTFSTCAADGEFDLSDGSIDLALRVAANETPGAGRGHAIGLAWFRVDDQLAEPVESLVYEVDVRIDEARASVSGLYANTVGIPAKGFSFAEASFFAVSEACGCPGATGNTKFVSTRHPGAPSDVEGATLTLRATIEPGEGDMVPAGPVEVAFLFHARVELAWSVVPGLPVPDTGDVALTFEGQLVEMRRVA